MTKPRTLKRDDVLRTTGIGDPARNTFVLLQPMPSPGWWRIRWLKSGMLDRLTPNFPRYPRVSKSELSRMPLTVPTQD